MQVLDLLFPLTRIMSVRKNSVSLNFCIGISSKTLLDNICKKANKLEATVSVRVKNSASLNFLYRELEKQNRILKRICKKANKLEATYSNYFFKFVNAKIYLPLYFIVLR